MSVLGICAATMKNCEDGIEVNAHNIANSKTTGYKFQQPRLETLAYRSLARPGAKNVEGVELPSALEIGSGAKISSIDFSTAQGSLEKTDNVLDLAINGRGYFIVQMPTGEIGYTRDGSFRIGPDGRILTQQGYELLPGFTVPENIIHNKITISSDGFISVELPTNPIQFQQIGQLELASFSNEQGLRPRSENILIETPLSGAPIIEAPGTNGKGDIYQAYLEASNVSSINEIVNMLNLQRVYEQCSRMMEADNEMRKTALNV